MKVKDLMTSQPTVIRPEDMVSQAATLMKQEDCGAIPVVTKDGKLVGIVTDRDIVIRAVAAGKDPRTTPVSAVMSADPVTLSPDASADDAEKLMADRQVRRLPVVAGGNLVGLIVTAQLARRGDAREVGETIKGISEAKSGKGSHARG
ncbi:MAG: CBS domain-containing protein [Chloroflexota bacterium]|jgi:CBS domain-containing protein|nr:CBS domain-containing protein [Chloroflexota bacterium]